MSECSTTTGGPVSLDDIYAVQNDDVSLVYSTVTIDAENIDTTSTMELYLLDQADGTTNFTLAGTQDTSSEAQWSFTFLSADNVSETVYDYTMRVTNADDERTTLAVGKIYVNADL